MTHNEPPIGHRGRMRERFLDDPGAVSEAELLELLLTYAVPRRDMAPQAGRLLARFGSLDNVLAATVEELTAVSGIGEHTAVLIKLVARLVHPAPSRQVSDQPQPDLARRAAPVDAEPGVDLTPDKQPEFAQAEMRTYADDEIANALAFIPQAAQFGTFEEFRQHLRDNLPYNSASTRHRRAGYIVDRFLPAERLDIPLVYYAACCTSRNDLKPAVFYHALKAEPIAARVAEELIWPALPMGRVDREDVREFVLRYLPEIGPASQNKVLRALFNTYSLLSIAVEDGPALRFHVHTGTLASFLYVLAAEFPEPGIYAFETLEQGPMRRWLLWDRNWMRRQLYNLRDLGVVSKISEIDAVRQFTLPHDQMTALRRYFEHPQRDTMAMREGSETGFFLKNPVSRPEIEDEN